MVADYVEQGVVAATLSACSAPVHGDLDGIRRPTSATSRRRRAIRSPPPGARRPRTWSIASVRAGRMERGDGLALVNIASRIGAFTSSVVVGVRQDAGLVGHEHRPVGAHAPETRAALVPAASTRR